MRHKTMSIGVLLIAGSICCAPAWASDEPVTTQLQQIIDDYLAQQGQTEKITGIQMQVSLDNGRQVISVSAGNDGLPHPRPMTPDSLFQIGSNTKSFTAALILKLEAEGKLNIDQTVGDWLPEYTAWKSITIKQLLNMTSHIPDYDSTVTVAEKLLDLHYQFTPRELIASVNPDDGVQLPNYVPITGWSYTNTGYFLADLIIEKASGVPYKEALEKMILKPLNLTNTYYYYGETPRFVLERMPAGFFNDPSCLTYQTGCTSPDHTPPPTSPLAPHIGKDVRAENMSWAGPAGGIISNMGDLALWYRALFGGRVMPQAQLEEMQSLVSTATGLPIPVTNAACPQGFGLGLDQNYSLSQFKGSIWYYEGETYADRVVFTYWPQYDVVLTMVANSNVPQSTFPLTVLPKTIDALVSTGTVTQH
jgi:D-alanyl-D-alanine carboxypeptidase